MNERVTIGVTITARQAEALLHIAAGAKQRPSEFVAWMIGNLTRATLEGDKIAALWAKGYHDGLICEATGMTRLQVATRRRKLGLPAHRQYPAHR